MENTKPSKPSTSLASLKAFQKKRFQPIPLKNENKKHEFNILSRSNPSYNTTRHLKLDSQKPTASSMIFSGVTVYINGYMQGISDLELRKLIQLHSGKVM